MDVATLAALVGDPTVRAYPRSEPQPLRGLDRWRFLLCLWRHGYRSVRQFQGTVPIRVDGIVGPQTWAAFYDDKKKG